MVPSLHHGALPSRHFTIHGGALISNILVRVMAMDPSQHTWLQGHSAILGQPLAPAKFSCTSQKVYKFRVWSLLYITEPYHHDTLPSMVAL